MTTETQATAENTILVIMADGTVRNFGNRGRLLSTEKVSPNGIEVTFHVVTGEQVHFKLETQGISEFLLEAAAYGFANKAKNATASTKVEDIAKVIQARVDAYNKGVWTNRAPAGESSTSLTQTQTAYAMVKGIDHTTAEGISTVRAIFSALTAEDKANLQKDPQIQVALAELRLIAAKELAAQAQAAA